MNATSGDARIQPRWWPLIGIGIVVVMLWVVAKCFNGSFRSYVPVTLTSDRAGLVMETDAKVKLRGVQVGRVGAIKTGSDSVRLQLELDPKQVKHIPANVQAQIAATTVFGAKYVELLYPADPSAHTLKAGASLLSVNVTAEVNTVFQNLVAVIDQVDPAELNSVLSAIAEGVQGQGGRIGQAVSSADRVLQALNGRNATIRENWRALKDVSDTYDAAAPDIVNVLSAAATTSTTITSHARDLDAVLLTMTGFARSGINLIGPNQRNLIHGVNVLEPTTDLFMKYNPSLTCTLVGGKNVLDDYDLPGYMGGSDGRSLIVDVALLLGDEVYRYPENLPINGAKGGPGGKPGCGSLPDVANNFPVRHLITNTGWGTGLDLRPNPGIGQSCYGDWFRVTRAVPLPPAIRQCLPGPAVGPQPELGFGTPPYGAQLYGPDGTPLYPGVPPAPPPPPLSGPESATAP